MSIVQTFPAAPKTAYLAAAIDHRNPGSIDPFSIMASKIAPITAFNPRDAFKNANTQPSDRFIAEVNFNAIKSADVVIAWVEQGSTSFGVPMELMFATMINKPVILVFDGAPGIYARLFTSYQIKLDELSTAKVEELCKDFWQNSFSYDKGSVANKSRDVAFMMKQLMNLVDTGAVVSSQWAPYGVMKLNDGGFNNGQ